jgi:hypothetical protein
MAPGPECRTVRLITYSVQSPLFSASIAVKRLELPNPSSGSHFAN